MAKAATQGVTRNCSIAVCHPSFCQNDGQCKIIEKNGYKVPSCTCKPGFTGVDCGEDVNECIPENDQDAVSVDDSDDETSMMLENLPDVRNSKGEVLSHKESQL